MDDTHSPGGERVQVDRPGEGSPVLSCVWTPSGPRGGGVSFTGCSDVAWNGPAPRATVVH